MPVWRLLVFAISSPVLLEAEVLLNVTLGLHTLNMPLAMQHKRLKRKRHADILTQNLQHKGDC